jgi:hypothetical protein
MPVVINEFEVVEAPPAEARKTDREPASQASPSRPIDPCAILPALRAIEMQTLRTWAH